MPKWFQLLLILSPWIFGFIGSVVYAIFLFFNKGSGEYTRKIEKSMEMKVTTFFDSLHFLIKVPVSFFLGAIAQGFCLGVIFIYSFFCPKDAAIF